MSKDKQIFINSIINKDVLLAEKLISKGININQVNDFDISPLQIASHKGYYGLVELLIKNDADINYETMEHKETALTFATSAGHIEIVKLLISHGADKYHKKYNGDNAIDIARKFGHNDISIFFGQEIDPQICGTSGDLQMDMLASIERDNVVRMLRSMKRQTLTNEEISTPLKIISIGIFGGGNIDTTWGHIQFQSIKTNVGYFIDFPHTGEIENPDTGNLLPCGTNWEQYMGTTLALESSIMYVLFKEYIFLRVFNNELHNFKPRSLVKQEIDGELISVKEPIDYNSDSSLYADLFSFAKEKGQTNTTNKIKNLINQNIDINKIDNNGQTALMTACEKGNIELVTFFLEHDAEVNIQDSEGFTALMLASGKGHLEIFKKLIQYDANIKIKNYRGQTAMYLAVKNTYIDIIVFLEEHGSKIESIEPLEINEEDYVTDIVSKIETELTSKEKVIEFLIYALNVNAEYELDLDYYIKDMGSKFNTVFQPGRNEKFSNEIVNAHNDMIQKYLIPLKFDDSIKNIIRCRIFDKLMYKYSLGKYENSKFEDIEGNKNNDTYKYSIKVEHKTYKIQIDIYSNSLILHTIDIRNNRASITYSKENGKYIHVTRGTLLITNNKIIETDIQGRQRVSSYKKIDNEFNTYIEEEDHNPKRLVSILNKFTKENPIKYSAHSFEWNRYGSYENFMVEVKQEFEKIEKDLKVLSPNLYTKIEKFLFDSKLNIKNTWGINQIEFGWSSSSLKEWCKMEDSKVNGKKAINFPLPEKFQKEVNHKTLVSFEDVCSVFKNEIEIRDDDRLSSLFEELEEDILGFDDGFEVKYINLEGITFYTDVEKFRSGLAIIFEQFKEGNRKQYKQIEVEVVSNTDLNYLDLKITQLRSYISKTSDEMKKEIKDGSFEDIRKSFTSLCDWSVDTKNKEESFGIKYLSMDTKDVEVYIPTIEAEGFTHILRFYK